MGFGFYIERLGINRFPKITVLLYEKSIAYLKLKGMCPGIFPNVLYWTSALK